MKINACLTIIFLALPTDLVAQQISELDQKLFDLPDVRFKQVDSHEGFPTYILNVRQPADHDNGSEGYFYQRVKLVHRGFDSPTVINTNGYGLEQTPMELFDLLDANFVSVEHRYFGPSTPKEKDWENLTIQQAAADLHHVRELLGKIYSGKWVGTGISKGGETATYYRYFYPDDVNVSVPYVAPFPIGLKDQRIYKFLDTMGSDECRKKIFAYQTSVLKHKAELVPRFRYFLKGKGAKVDSIGGPEAALEMFVLEYPFAFWQSGKNCEDIPAADADADTLLNHLIDNGDFAYLFDKSTETLAPHYYQHATQYGYYGYRAERFGDLIQKWEGEPSACFFPDVEQLKFDPSVRENLTKWLKSDAKNIVFLYGAVDTWTVAQADIGDNQKVRKYIFPGKHHGNARLKSIDESKRKEILDFIRERISD